MLAITQAVFAEDNFEKKAQVNNWNSIYKIIRMKCQTGHLCLLCVFLMLKFSVKINVPPGQNLARASGNQKRSKYADCLPKVPNMAVLLHRR